ncbi:MerR family transcriptional regulator [Microbacterium sp.]|uniref:MerR family transcriptional regulator n=1 Tax=Microbacterium sp. TaxID=51671 RepID=UPI002B45EEF4|nr:MerR family transcriptional regulator [Microbacterium sp.]
MRISIVSTSMTSSLLMLHAVQTSVEICTMRGRFVIAPGQHPKQDIRGDERRRFMTDSGLGVYGISVAAELVGMGVQNLRAYEARGLLIPARTDGGTRRYSADDLDRLRRIRGLLADGLNLAGIAMVMHLQDENGRLRRALAERSPMRGEAG